MSSNFLNDEALEFVVLDLENINALTLGIHIDSTCRLFLGEGQDGKHSAIGLPEDVKEGDNLTVEVDLLMRHIVTTG